MPGWSRSGSTIGTALYRGDGTSWTLGAGAPANLAAVGGGEADDVWVVGARATAAHWDAAASTATSHDLTSESFGSIWGAAADDVWATTDGGFFRWDGEAWTVFAETVPVPPGALWGFAADDIWATGNRMMGRQGTTLHWDGTAWTEAPCGEIGPLHGILGPATDDLWAVGGIAADAPLALQPAAYAQAHPEK